VAAHLGKGLKAAPYPLFRNPSRFTNLSPFKGREERVLCGQTGFLDSALATLQFRSEFTGGGVTKYTTRLCVEKEGHPKDT
jgi:hypothetical protein